MSVRPEDLGNGVYRVSPYHTTLLGTSPRSVLLVFVSTLGLEGFSLQSSEDLDFSIPRGIIVCKKYVYHHLLL